jgi:hypothetical protein
MTRPRRQKKPDRLLHPDAVEVDIRVDMAVGCFDEVAREMDRKWGIDRLQQVVPVEVADKYGRALAALNEAIRERDPEKTKWNAENCVKGMRKMDEIAEAAGRSKAEPRSFEYDFDGLHFIVVDDERLWPALREQRGDKVLIVTLREVGVALKALRDPAVAAVKHEFDRSEIVAIRPPVTGPDPEDEIPW